MAKELELLSKDYEEVRYTPSGADVVAGQVVQVGSGVYGFAIADIDDGDEGVVVVKAENVKAAKEASLAIASGAYVYFDTTAREVDTTNTNVLVGMAIKAAAAADTYAYINFDGRAAFLKA